MSSSCTYTCAKCGKKRRTRSGVPAGWLLVYTRAASGALDSVSFCHTVCLTKWVVAGVPVQWNARADRSTVVPLQYEGDTSPIRLRK